MLHENVEYQTVQPLLKYHSIYILYRGLYIERDEHLYDGLITHCVRQLERLQLALFCCSVSHSFSLSLPASSHLVSTPKESKKTRPLTMAGSIERGKGKVYCLLYNRVDSRRRRRPFCANPLAQKSSSLVAPSYSHLALSCTAYI